MSILNRLFGTESEPRRAPDSGTFAKNDDERALDRYRYMVRTAPPETLEQAHAEAFARLTPEQRQRVLAELQRTAPPEEAERVRDYGTIEPSTLARFATRAEYRQPGTVERALGGAGAGFGNLLTTFAAAFAGSMVANSFFSALGHAGTGDVGAANDTSESAQNGDFSEEFGQGADEDGFAGGEGFDGDDFDPMV